MSDKKVYTIKEFAALISVHHTMIRKAIEKGTVKAVRFGRKYAINKAEVERVINEGFEV